MSSNYISIVIISLLFIFPGMHLSLSSYNEHIILCSKRDPCFFAFQIKSIDVPRVPIESHAFLLFKSRA